MKKISIVLLCGAAVASFAGAATSGYFIRTALYFDWFGARYEEGSFMNQLSTRLKFEFSPNSTRDWTVLVDVRDRYNMSESSRNQFILYDARVTYNPQDRPPYISVGQMNLYDTAGIGRLLGGIVGFKIKRNLLLGGYAGLEQSTYVHRLDFQYQKFGLFARYDGPGAKSFSLSYNNIRYEGQNEQQDLYVQAFLPVQRKLFIYGNVQYELSPRLAAKDRLSLLFLNARVDITPYADAMVYYSQGKGFDFHRYLMDRSLDPSLNDQDLQRFFYSRMVGLRLSIKPVNNIKLYVSRQESEQMDYGLKNHTWRLGASAWDILKSGFSLYGDYSLNRGELAESDSFNISLNKDFGRISWHASFSNTYTGFRYVGGADTPRIIHFSNYANLATSVFYYLNRSISMSVEYSFFMQDQFNQHHFFVRMMFRR